MEPKRQLWYILLGGGSSFEAFMSLIGLIPVRNGVAGITDSVSLGEIMLSVVIAVVLVVINLERTRPPASTCDYH